MPHECVSCGEVFDDGADEVFDGCPDCGATKFFYVKEVTKDAPSDETDEVSSVPAESTAQTRARNQTHNPEDDPDAVDEITTDPPTVTHETTTPTQETETKTGTTEPDTTPKTETTSHDTTTGEDDIVEADSEYDEAFGGKLDDEASTGETASEPDEITSSGGRKFRRARPEEARRRLMDQFETIRIVEPGSYELNLMNLYEEDEKIIALQEDGRYQVSLPSTFDD
jgi:predicted  nucleic acid-binding Zn-ribbon protein